MKKLIQNRIIRVKKKSPGHLLSVLLTTLSVFLIILGALGLVYVQQPLTDLSFDPRNDASVANGQVELSTTFQNATAQDENGHITLLYNAHSRNIQQIELVFSVITDVFDTPTVELTSNSGLRTTRKEIEQTTDGYLVSMTVVPQSGSSFTGTTPKAFAQINFKPTQSGDIDVSFDTQTSKALVFQGGSSNAINDELKHVPLQSYSVQVAGATQKDDLRFANQTRVAFLDNAGNAVNPNQIKRGQTYTLHLIYQVQNSIKSQAADNRQVGVRYSINGQSYGNKSYDYSFMAGPEAGFTDSVKQSYVLNANSVKIGVMVDPGNTIAESNESNNSWETTFTVAGVGGLSVVSCNESCTSNAQCGVNQRCFENRCRLVTNLSSTSCSAPADNGLHRSCNQYCADTRECGTGFSCYFNRCRRPDNVESTVCALPTTAQQTLITQSCNKACSSNAQCANNMRCYSSVCRLATNPSSTSCSPVTKNSVSGTYYGEGSKGGPGKGAAGGADQPVSGATPGASGSTGTSGATPSGTTRPFNSTGSAQATFSAGLISPRPVPTVAPAIRTSPSPISAASNGALNFLTRFTGGLSLPLIALVVGIGLLALVIVITLLNVLKKRNQGGSNLPGGRTTPYEQDLQSKINELKQQQSTPVSGPAVSGPAVAGPNPPAAPKAAQVAPISPTKPTANDSGSITPPPSTLRPSPAAVPTPTPDPVREPVSEAPPIPPVVKPPAQPVFNRPTATQSQPATNRPQTVFNSASKPLQPFNPTVKPAQTPASAPRPGTPVAPTFTPAPSPGAAPVVQTAPKVAPTEKPVQRPPQPPTGSARSSMLERIKLKGITPPDHQSSKNDG